MRTVISQPMYFPWCGFINQVLLSDTFVNYDDVQLSRGFYNRVQVKIPSGIKFVTVPIRKRRQDLLINSAEISYDTDWVSNHRAMFHESFKQCKFRNDALEIFDRVHEKKYKYLSDLSFQSIIEILKYLKIYDHREYVSSSDLNLHGSGSQRLLDITMHLGASTYITGHGAINYLNHELFEKNKISVQYMNYRIKRYNQSHGDFTPFVSSLDAIAHIGPATIDILDSTIVGPDRVKKII